MIKVTWTSPSNIALVKYWGKFGVQLPQNPSLSFTLKNSFTTLSVSASKKDYLTTDPCLTFLFEEKPNFKFQEKIEKFLKNQLPRFPWLLNYSLDVCSSNTFPHSSGIASSASSMSALCLSLLSLDEVICDKKYVPHEFFKLASELSRLASGSASRSLYGGLAFWGESSLVNGSSDLFAIPFNECHSFFKDYCDSILIVDEGEKSLSSRAGHGLMENHPFSKQRYEEARLNLAKLIEALKKGDVNNFIEVVEDEALMLHALMMTSKPSFILLKGHSLSLIEKIRNFRKEQNIPVCFTIDAGPNIHLLYPEKYKTIVIDWIESDLSFMLSGKKWIHDEVGLGPIQLKVQS